MEKNTSRHLTPHVDGEALLRTQETYNTTEEKCTDAASAGRETRRRSLDALLERVGPPRVGMRNLKTAAATALVALVYYFLGRSPAFACIGAIFGMGADMEDSRRHGGNRLFGTVIGGLLGMALFRFYLLVYPEGGHSLLLVPLTFVGTVLLILLCQIFWVGGVQPGGVVLCILLFNTPVDAYVSYALNRIVDTGIGVAVALLINYLFPREQPPRWLSSLWARWRGDVAGTV